MVWPVLGNGTTTKVVSANRAAALSIQWFLDGKAYRSNGRRMAICKPDRFWRCSPQQYGIFRRRYPEENREVIAKRKFEAIVSVFAAKLLFGPKDHYRFGELVRLFWSRS